MPGELEGTAARLIAELADAVPTALTSSFTRIAREKTILRRLIETATGITEAYGLPLRQ
jgi:replicative DNA helicase